VAPPQFARAHR